MAVKTLNDHIVSTPGIVGGRPRIAGHRITVADIMVWHELMGQSADEIAADYNLNLADIYAALAYYFDHREEIDIQIQEDEVFIEAIRQQTPSLLAQKHDDQ
jgi:uncharacterized protein (DUF433 family)